MIIDNNKILKELAEIHVYSASKIDEILKKAKELKGLNYSDVLTLLKANNKTDLNKIFDTAKYIKQEIYGNRIVLFAPLYISNLCNNECLYCAFRNTNTEVVRRALSQHEVENETTELIKEGHKRLLLVAGESYGKEGLKYILDSIDSVYKVSVGKSTIRRVNVNIAPLSVQEFKLLLDRKIGTYQLFQETYHEDTYKKLHLKGPKSNYNYRLETMDRAFEAGFQDLGIGLLFGLYDWKYEVLALLEHIKHLEAKYGVGPHTISVPRIEPALNSEISYNPPYPVNDTDFKKIIAVLRIAVPYTGIILSTRESREMRLSAFELGISQISAGSKTNPGGYTDHDTKKEHNAEQFSLGDTRTLLEVIKDVVDKKHIPSFCTGCYRLGRVGKDFMDLAKPGLIKQNCLPNAMFTFVEYMEDFGDAELKDIGYKLILENIKTMPSNLQNSILSKIEVIKAGERDIYI